MFKSERKTLDNTGKASFSSRMRIGVALALFSAAAAPVLAQENATAYEALREISTRFSRSAAKNVISITGLGGDPQPETWKVLLEDRRAQSGIREIEVSNGRISSERTPKRGMAGSVEGATIDLKHLNLDSSGAFAVANYTAEKANTHFETVSYTLRTDDRGNPVWVVTLHDEKRRPVGTIHIGANKGVVTRTEGMFRGAPMDRVVEEPLDEEEEYAEEESEEEGEGKGGIDGYFKRMFRRTQEDARRIFRNVRRSASDFIAPD